MRGTLLILIALAAVTCISVVARLLAPKADERACEAMLDSYVAHRLRAANPEVTDDEIARAREQAREIGSRTFAACPRAVTQRQVQCAMEASYADAVERCLQAP